MPHFSGALVLAVLLAVSGALGGVSGGFVAVDTDGSLEQLLALLPLVRRAPTVAGALRLVTVFTGTGRTDAVPAVANVKNVLAAAGGAAAGGAVRVALGAVASARDLYDPARTVADCRDVPAVPLAPTDTPSLLSGGSGGVGSGAALRASTVDESLLFGAALELDPAPQPWDDSDAPATDALAALLASDAPAARIDYIALAGLTNLAAFLRSPAATPAVAARLNVHIFTGPGDANIALDAESARFVLSYPDLYRSVYTASFAEPVAAMGAERWAAYAGLGAQIGVPRVAKTLLAALGRKAASFAARAGNAQAFAVGPHGPTAALVALAVTDATVRNAISEETTAVVTVVATGPAPIVGTTGGQRVTLSLEVLHAESPVQSHLFRNAYPQSGKFWERYRAGFIGAAWMDVAGN